MRLSTPHDAESWIPAHLKPQLSLGGRLLVMSNRAPIRLVRDGDRERIEPTVGGVGTTFMRLLERHGGMWIAWAGARDRSGRARMPPREPRFEMVFTPLTEREIGGYYHGLCNRGLWPLMHFMPTRCRFDSSQWNLYRRANHLFAATAIRESASYDLAWIQDFHLALVPGFLRQNRPALPIGLFWHVPWPPEQIFRIFPWRQELLGGMLAADLIGFHTTLYVRHFLDCCERIMKWDVDRDAGIVRHGGETTRVRAFPLGIPADFFQDLSRSAEVRVRARRIRRSLRTPIVILGVDRLDYTKGILERLLGFERFLELNPQYRRQVTLVLIAVPSRTRVADYAALKRELDELVGRVVGRFSSEGWVPIRYHYDQFGAAELTAYYQAADIALLTPLRDGMNLVAKEYVASQIGDSAVLILSEFAGAAEEFTDALLVNPYDIDQIAGSIKRAIEMPADEKRQRLVRLRDRVWSNNLEHWSDDFLHTLLAERPLAEHPTLAASAD
jgi:trehalose 6-phosphate synthase/phosphatase